MGLYPPVSPNRSEGGSFYTAWTRCGHLPDMHDDRMTFSTPSIKAAAGYEGQTFRIDGGDGDQVLFGSPLVFRKVTASWFNGNLGQLFGEGWLVEVTEGPRTGLLLGLSPRTIGEIREGLAEDGFKSVVVHGIDYLGYDPVRHGPRTLIGGMAFMEPVRE